jgi:hypothetical protein
VAVGSNKHGRATGNRCSADSPDKGVGDVLVADADRITLTCLAFNVEANIDIIIACREIGPS